MLAEFRRLAEKLFQQFRFNYLGVVEGFHSHVIIGLAPVPLPAVMDELIKIL